MFAIILAIPVSIALLVWISRMKKDDPFPKGTIIKLLIAGVISGTLSGIITILGAVVNFVMEFGFEPIRMMFGNSAESAQYAAEFSELIKNAQYSPLNSFIKTFILVGFVEEIFKYLCTKAVIAKKGIARTWMDTLLCFAVTAIGFQLSEDIQYASGSVMTAIYRALTPYHFTFAAIMGYYYGLAKTSGKKFYMFLAIFIPSLIHTLFDFSISALQHEEMYLLLFIAMTILLTALTILMIVKINKWNKNKKLDVEI